MARQRTKSINDIKRQMGRLYSRAQDLPYTNEQRMRGELDRRIRRIQSIGHRYIDNIERNQGVTRNTTGDRFTINGIKTNDISPVNAKQIRREIYMGNQQAKASNAG